MANVRLTERDQRILMHVGRFGMTTREVLSAPWFCGSIDAAKTVLRRLAAPLRSEGESRTEHNRKVSQCYLQTRNLGFGKRRYFQLTRLAIRMLGLPDRRADELGAQALPTRYAILVHCCLRGTPRLPLTRREFHQHLEEWRERLYPDLSRESVTALPYDHTYYVAEHAGRTRLVRMVLDLGATEASIAAKCRVMLAELEERSEFMARLIQRRHFGLAILTGTAGKREGIHQQLAGSPPGGVSPVIDIVEHFQELAGGHDQPSTVLPSGPRQHHQLRPPAKRSFKRRT